MASSGSRKPLGSSGSGSSSRNTNPGSNTKPASTLGYQFKFSNARKTASEQLLDTMKSIGYHPPKSHQQHPEHFDYLFQDRNTSQFVQRLMTKTKSQNVVGKVEMSKILKLKEDNLLVYGKPLEQLANRAKEARSLKQYEALEKEHELMELKGKIRRAKKNIEALNNLEIKFKENEEQKNSENALCKYEMNLIEKNCRDINEELKLNEAEEEEIRKNIMAEVQYRLGTLRATQIQGIITELVDKGSQVESVIRDRMKVKVDFESDLLSQPMSPFEISKTFEQYGKDFERLKHVIIYEIIQQIQNECKQSCTGAVSGKIVNFRKENERTLKLTRDIQMKMITEKAESVELLQKSMNLHVNKKLKQLRQNLVTKFDEDIHQVQEKKYETRRQIQNYYEVFANILIKQFANLLICDGLIKKQNQETILFVNCLKQFCESISLLNKEAHYFASNLVVADLPPEKQIIAKLFKDNGISLEILRSGDITTNALSLIHSKEKYLLEEEDKKNEALIALKLNELSQNWSDLRSQWKLNETKRLQWKAEHKHVRDMEKEYEKFKEKMKIHVVNKDRLVKEAIKKKEETLAKIKSVLTEYRNRDTPVNNENTANLDNKKRRSSVFSKSFDLITF